MRQHLSQSILFAARLMESDHEYFKKHSNTRHARLIVP